MNKFKKAYSTQFPKGTDQSRALYGLNWAAATAAQKNARTGMGYRGEGDYKSFMSKFVPKGSWAYAGRTLGGMSGIPGAGAVGSFIGNKIANFTGFGDYSSNSLAGGDMNNQTSISVNKTDNTGDIFVTRSEFVQNVTVTGPAGGTTLFQLSSFGLNPGLSQTFPWLSQIAQNYALYDFEGLMFQYKPMFTESAGSSSSLGKVIMATSYDPEQTVFRSSIEMENYDYANASKPSSGMVHGVETAQRQQALNMLYIRTGATTRSLVFSDIGRFMLATEGVPLASAQTTAIVGELWVTYRVRLSRAELYNSLLGYAIATDVLRGTCSTSSLTSGTTFVKSTNSIGVQVVATGSTSSFQILFPVNISLGSYQIMAQFSSGATAFAAQSSSVFNAPLNCVTYFPGTSLPGAGGSFYGPGGTYTGTTSNNSIYESTYITISSPGLSQASIICNVANALTSTSTWSVIVTQSNTNVSLSLL